ncbi:threonine/serine exporter family protein, partial [Staphylococcus epidermidis]|uniref:threonine/serine exporter family protein n=1 Tax=Staphylococcus epidermidis TaxID=1282 RepID=UPI0037D9AB0C
MYHITLPMHLPKLPPSFLPTLILPLITHTITTPYNQPLIIFILPPIIPLLPPPPPYQPTTFLLSNNYTNPLNTFLHLTLISPAIPFAILLSQILYYIYSPIKQS